MRAEAKRWLEQAREEFDTAKISLKVGKYFAAAFWCQQSIEKYFKALYIIKKRKSAGTTHSLTYLGRQLDVPKKYYKLLRDLTSEYFFSRYPDATEDTPFKTYSKQETIVYLDESGDIIKWIESKIKE